MFRKRNVANMVNIATQVFTEFTCISLLYVQHNARGILSMANSGPNTNGSQFFISYGKQPHLNGLYTIFGKVIHGFEVLDIMEKVSSWFLYILSLVFGSYLFRMGQAKPIGRLRYDLSKTLV